MNKTQRLIQLMMAVNERLQFTTKEMADEFWRLPSVRCTAIYKS